VSDGSKYGDEPDAKDTEHVVSGLKKHGGTYDGASDKGAYFKFKSHDDAKNFKNHVDRCPNRSCHADLHEEVELDEVASVKTLQQRYSNVEKKYGDESKKDYTSVKGRSLMKKIARTSYNKHGMLLQKNEEFELEEGRQSQRHPLEGHEYHKKTNAELEYIAKDAHKAAEAMKGHNTTAENKYRDQANDSATVRYFRKKSGTPDWYKKKYGLNEAKEKTEYDYEGDMARGQLQSVINNAQRVHDMLKDNDNLPEWVQSKITLAEDYISTVANYMMSEIDESVNSFVPSSNATPVPKKPKDEYDRKVDKYLKQR
jgi:hypothetical protein